MSTIDDALTNATLDGTARVDVAELAALVRERNRLREADRGVTTEQALALAAHVDQQNETIAWLRAEVAALRPQNTTVNRSEWLPDDTWRDPDCIECGGEGAPCCEPPDGPPPGNWTEPTISRLAILHPTLRTGPSDGPEDRAVSSPHNMIPQGYPLGCKTVSFGYYLVIGWTTDGLPVVVLSGNGGSDSEEGPKVLAGQVAEYYIPEEA